MKKTYITPTIRIIELATQGIICTSGQNTETFSLMGNSYDPNLRPTAGPGSLIWGE